VKQGDGRDLGDAADHQAITLSATLGPQAGATLSLARLLIEFANADFLLDAAALNELPKPTDSLLGRLFVTQCQLNHAELPFFTIDSGCRQRA
jgi:hypothetical protein